MEPHAERVRDYADALERAALDREKRDGRELTPEFFAIDSHRSSRSAARLLAAACLAVLVGASLLLAAGRGDRPVDVTVAGGSGGLPLLAFRPGLMPRSAPVAAWATPPYVTGLQEYEVSDGTAPTRRFRYVGFSQKLAADGSAHETITMVISDAVEGDFDPTKLSALLTCSETMSLRGRDTVVGIDPARGGLVFVWQERSGIAVVVSVHGYQRTAAAELLGHIGEVDAEAWSTAIKGVGAVLSSGDTDANWRQFERFRTGSASSSGRPPVTVPVVGGQSCP